MTFEKDPKFAEEITNWTMVFPNQANPNGNMFGGEMLAIMDTTAAMAAKRFSEKIVSTVTVEAVHFCNPIVVGDSIKTTAKVVAVGETSMIVKAIAYKDSGNNILVKSVSAFFILVAFDANRKPVLVPQLLLSEEDKVENSMAIVVKQSAMLRNKNLLELQSKV